MVFAIARVGVRGPHGPEMDPDMIKGSGTCSGSSGRTRRGSPPAHYGRALYQIASSKYQSSRWTSSFDRIANATKAPAISIQPVTPIGTTPK